MSFYIIIAKRKGYLLCGIKIMKFKLQDVYWNKFDTITTKLFWNFSIKVQILALNIHKEKHKIYLVISGLCSKWMYKLVP